MTHPKRRANEDVEIEEVTRRRFLARTTNAILGVISAVLGVILGGAIFSPRIARTEENWLPATKLADLPDNEPTVVTLRVVREDGYRQVVDRRTIFLVKTGESKVLALDSTCTHLGCRVSWDPQSQLIKCPCHGGVYDRTGGVMAGPPPAPLAQIAARVEEDRVLVQI